MGMGATVPEEKEVKNIVLDRIHTRAFICIWKFHKTIEISVQCTLIWDRHKAHVIQRDGTFLVLNLMLHVSYGVIFNRKLCFPRDPQKTLGPFKYK